MTWSWYRVEVPIASFVIPLSRELPESYPFPPPTTVYGMLLSYIGETNRTVYRGTRLVIGVVSVPEVSWVLRKTRRFKQAKIDSKENSKPDYVCLLTSLDFIVGVKDSIQPGVPSLNGQVQSAYLEPGAIARFGGLSCGESHNLVNRFGPLTQDISQMENVWWLTQAAEGEWTVPTWVDHVGSERSVWVGAQFQPESWELIAEQIDHLAFTIDNGGIG